MRHLAFDELLDDADLVITAEVRASRSSPLPERSDAGGFA
jgi:hypothetical protein